MALSFRACPGRLELPPSCCTLDCSDHSSSPVHGVAMHSDSQTPERSWAFFLRSIGYHPVTGIVRVYKEQSLPLWLEMLWLATTGDTGICSPCFVKFSFSMPKKKSHWFFKRNRTHCCECPFPSNRRDVSVCIYKLKTGKSHIKC